MQALRTRMVALLCAALPVLLAVLVRVPGLDRPLVGNFATKNAVYGMIARNFALGRAPLEHPMLDVLAGGERSLHLVELPVSAYLTGLAWKLCGGSLDLWGRATSVVFSALAVGLLYVLVQRWHGRTAAMGAALALALSPVAIVYGQSFMLEASVVCCSLGAIYAWERWTESRRWSWWTCAVALLALAVMSKAYMAVMLLPLAWTWLRRAPREGAARNEGAAAIACPLPAAALAPARGKTGVFAAATGLLLALLPAAAWYAYVWQAAAQGGELAARAYYSARQSSQAHAWPHPLLFSGEFYRSVLDNVCGFVLTPLGVLLCLLGLMDRTWRRHAVWLLAMGALLLALPRKFHEMNYYYLPVLPPLCVLIGLGWQQIREKLHPRPAWTVLLLLCAGGLAFRYAARPAFFTPREDQSVTVAAEAVRRLTAAEERVATMHGTTIDLLYYCDRPGWIVPPRGDFAQELLQCQRQGARLLVVAGWDSLPSTIREQLGALRVAARGSDFRVLWLEQERLVAMRAQLKR